VSILRSVIAHCSAHPQDWPEVIQFETMGHAGEVEGTDAEWAIVKELENEDYTILAPTTTQSSAADTTTQSPSAGAHAFSDGEVIGALAASVSAKPSLIEAVRSLEEMPQLSLTRRTSFGDLSLFETKGELIVALAASASAITTAIKHHVEYESVRGLGSRTPRSSFPSSCVTLTYMLTLMAASALSFSTLACALPHTQIVLLHACLVGLPIMELRSRKENIFQMAKKH